jgi:hypothetical protein
MNGRYVWSVLALAIGLLASAGEAAAQMPARYYPPAGPTLPAQLNYFRRDVGLLDQYNAFVQPNQRAAYQFQQLANQQQADFQAAQKQFNQLKEIRPSEAAPTGVGATFMNYGHYYRLQGGAAGRVRSR